MAFLFFLVSSIPNENRTGRSSIKTKVLLRFLLFSVSRLQGTLKQSLFFLTTTPRKTGKSSSYRTDSQGRITGTI